MKYWRWVRSVKGTVLWSGLALIPLLTAFLGLDIPFMNSSLLMMIVICYPCMVCCAYLIGGSLSMLLEVILGSYAMYLGFGTGGAVIGAVLLVIPACVYVYLCEKDTAFHKSIVAMLLTYTAVNIGLFIWLRAWCGGDILGTAAKAVEDSFRSMTFMGETGIGDESVRMIGQMYFGSTGDDLESIYASLRILTEETTLSLILSQVSNVILSSVIAVGAAKHFARRSGLRKGIIADLPKNGMPALREWYIPRQWGAAIGLFAIGIVIEWIFKYEEHPSLNIAGTVFFGIFQAFYLIQGIALLNWLHHKRGSGRFVRVFVPVLVIAILPIAAVLLGVWDQWKDIRGLRGPKQDKEETDV